MRFWDSSALVPLVTRQPASRLADRWLSEDGEVVVWTLSSVELASAIHRLRREGTVDEDALETAERRIDDLLAASHVVLDLEAVKAQARRLARVHPLRAGDALQLGAASEWAAGRPVGRAFCTLDQRLAAAAWREGFRVPS